MRIALLSIWMLLPLALVAFPSMASQVSNDQCLACHADLPENPIEAHRNCMACHGSGADAHIQNFQTPPAPVSNATCTTCHQKDEAFMSISGHGLEMECSACHKVHEGA